MKTGRLSKDDERYILTNAGRMTPEKIASNLNRSLEVIDKFIRKNYKPKQKVESGEETEIFIIKQELRNSEQWKILESEFTKDELRLFEEQYIKLMNQFKSNVLPTEETQIFQAIKLDILMHRNLAARQRSLQDIQRLEHAQDDFLKAHSNVNDMDQTDKDFAMALDQQLQAARNAEQFRTTEYVKLHERHGKILETLKATREQRIKDIEDSKESLLGLFKMLQQKDLQEQVGRETELLRLSGEKEYDRLGQLHEYEDGGLDRPILSADTIDLYEEEESDEQEN